jgi:hypothetical protein
VGFLDDLKRQAEAVKAEQTVDVAAMPLFWKPYTSDVTQFIDPRQLHRRSLKAKKPTLESEQRAGRALLWDRASTARRRPSGATRACRSSPTSTRPSAE